MRRLIGLTGPSAFSPDCMEAVETLLEANFVLLYHNSDTNMKHWLNAVHGIIVAGGLDIHPSVYDYSIWNNHNLTKFDLKRDVRELGIIEHCLRHHKPLLGICRGHQLLGLRHGFEMVQDLSQSTICHQPSKNGIEVSVDEPVHAVDILCPETFYKDYDLPLDIPERARIAGLLHKQKKEQLWVNSFHHQAILYDKKMDFDALGLQVVGTARIDLDQRRDKIIEFMQGPNWLSVQWHPEYDYKENTVSRKVLEKFKRMVNAHGRSDDD